MVGFYTSAAEQQYGHLLFTLQTIQNAEYWWRSKFESYVTFSYEYV